MPTAQRTIVVLGTGGTISAAADSPDENVAYRAGAVGAEAMAATLSAGFAIGFESEQVAAIDSKDMDFPTWRRLGERVAFHLLREQVAGVVVTHGTDTLEETAWFLQRVLAPAKPVVLTAAMRPASSRQSDGPQNLADAVAVVLQAPGPGVVAVLAGTVYSARNVRKVHPYRLDAFGSGDAGPLAYVEAGRLRCLRTWPQADAAIGLGRLPMAAADWPYVAIAASTAAADARSVTALVEAGCAGIVVAATGNGTVAREFEAGLQMASARGVAVLRATRCSEGAIVDGGASAWLSAGDLTPQKARVELIVRLLAAR